MTGMLRYWMLVPALFLSLSLGGVDVTSAQSAEPAAKPARASKSSGPRVAQAGSSAGHVYLLRGLLNIFSLGMDDLASKIQARGISASVHNHSEWQGLADDIAAKFKAGRHGPIVLVGHSLGADAVMFMGEYLGKKGVPVALIVPFDGTGSFAASSNVARVMNLTQRDYAYMRRGAGFRGELANIDVSSHGVGHIEIDKSARLHAMVLAKIQGVIGRGRVRTQTAGDGGAPAPRARPASATAGETPAPSSSSSSPADTATTASTSATVRTTPSAETAAPKPVAAEPSDTSANRVPARSESAPADKPALRF